MPECALTDFDTMMPTALSGENVELSLLIQGHLAMASRELSDDEIHG